MIKVQNGVLVLSAFVKLQKMALQQVEVDRQEQKQNPPHKLPALVGFRPSLPPIALRPPMLPLRYALIFISLAAYAIASSGDRSAEFQNCVVRCSIDTCVSSSMLPLALQLTRWTCADDCRYTCMHLVTNKAVELGLPVEQYYGKWPFWRWAGMQEPASVAFSLLNLWFHTRGVSKVQRSVPNGHTMKKYYLLWAIISMNAWVWSSVFHTRGKLCPSRFAVSQTEWPDRLVQIYRPQKSWTTFQRPWLSVTASTGP